MKKINVLRFLRKKNRADDEPHDALRGFSTHKRKEFGRCINKLSILRPFLRPQRPRLVDRLEGSSTV